MEHRVKLGGGEILLNAGATSIGRYLDASNSVVDYWPAYSVTSVFRIGDIAETYGEGK